ncbi:MAG TPA: phosphoribosylformylglycinamidine cyclo-ligase [Caldisericia bacterium]|nr:phosphoribosylformylglycinamidine cyclo-ligase [Caldisericia bacterium]
MKDLYKEAGVQTLADGTAMQGLLHWVNQTFRFRSNNETGHVLLPIGFFANVIHLHQDIGLAVSTDGVGTKLLIAEQLEKYDTIGIDCVAMNVNDLICVGAEPISFLDYIAVADYDSVMIEQIAIGLYEGCKMANIPIPGGEIAQVRDLLHPKKNAFDLVGTAIGVVKKDNIITGKNIEETDVIIGFPSSGLHSNGFTLARKVLLSGYKDPPTSLLLELLTPTEIYVKTALMLLEKCNVKGFANITGDGLLNILRLDSSVEYCIEDPLPVPAIFQTIQEAGEIPTEEMYKDFNMGLGFVAILSKSDYRSVHKHMEDVGITHKKIGTIRQNPYPKLTIPSLSLVAEKGNVYVRK